MSTHTTETPTGALLIPVVGNPRIIPMPLTLTDTQKLVGGYIETVGLRGARFAFNEEPFNAQVNRNAARLGVALYGQPLRLAGDVLVFGEAIVGGEWTPVNSEVLDALTGVGVTIEPVTG